MAFVRVTDPELAAQLYAAGLLYEKCWGGPLDPKPAKWWNPDVKFWRSIMATSWRFYVLLEE